MNMEIKELKNIVQNDNYITTQLNVINLLFNSPELNNRILVIVEGKDDKKVYGYHLSSEIFHIHIYGTCNNYSELVEKLNCKHPDDFFAIKDADFDILNNVKYSSDNLFLTDTHDLETMLIKNNTDFKSKLEKEYDIDSSEDFILQCVKHISFLSYLKWYSSKYELKLNFECIRIYSIFNGVNFDKKKCLEELYKNPKNRGIFSDAHRKSFTEFIEMNFKIDKWQLTNGHDLCCAIALFIKHKAESKPQFKDDSIPQLLRMSYAAEKFHETNLYKTIQEWVFRNKKIQL